MGITPTTAPEPQEGPKRASESESKGGYGSSVAPEADEAQIGEVIGVQTSFYTKSRQWIRSIGAEQSGIERVPESARVDQSPWSLFLIFFSANCCTATMALGYLGPTTFGLGWWDSFLCIAIFNLIGAVGPALIAGFGHRMGLRTITIPRYSFGWWPARVVAMINIITQIGWGIVNDLSGADILYDVGDGKLPSAVCVILIGIIAIIVGVLGYDYVHKYERYAWIIMLICFTILAGFGGPHFVNVPMATGSVEASSILSFGTTIIGFEIAWVPIAADYSVYMRETTSDWAVCGCAYAGLFISQLLIELLGVAVGTLYLSSETRFPAAYERSGLGGLIGEVFSDRGTAVRGLGKFVEAVLSFSTAAVIVCGIYSIGLSAQMVSTKAVKVPRFVCSLAGSVVFLVCAVAGRDHLESVMTNFLNMCAYYLTPLTTIILVEHYIWRRGFTYNLEAWNNESQLPVGIAASVSFISGTLIALLSMSQVWWVGPIAEGIGGSSAGTDISWILAAVVSTVVYIPTRYLERRKWKR
jgi:NCS1 nucleoside transporter family